MLLQNVPLQLFPACPEIEMYYRVSGGTAEFRKGSLRVSTGAEISFDTYFGGFMPRNWLRRTALSGLSLRLKMAGRAELHLMRLCSLENGIAAREIDCRVIDSIGEETEVDFGTIHAAGVYYFTLAALSDIKLTSAEYHCPDEPLNTDVFINAVICTYKREKAVAATLQSLNESIFSRDESPLHGRLRVTLVDNARTLNEGTVADGTVTVLHSPNLGGAGGFTRGILDAMSHSDTTHVLLMDDDAAVMPRSLEITFAFLSLLRPEHSDLTVAGALLRSDLPWYQYEAGAQWNGGHIIQNGHGLDLCSQDDLVECSGSDGFIDYSGWWFSCIPVSQIKKIGLPLPFFLHRDDVEYGLRCSGRFIALPGACVWHEAMESKLSGLSEYYDLRNLFITNAIHCPDFTLQDYRNTLRKWYLRNLFAHRYKYIDMNLAGARDALRGIDWLLEQDTRELHKRIARMNYAAVPIRKLEGASEIDDLHSALEAQREMRKEVIEPGRSDKIKKAFTVLLDGGLRFPAKQQPILAVQPAPMFETFRSGRVIHCDWGGKGFSVVRDKDELKRCREKYLRLLDILDVRFEDARAGYSERWPELCTEERWRVMLGIDEESLRKKRAAERKAAKKKAAAEKAAADNTDEKTAEVKDDGKSSGEKKPSAEKSGEKKAEKKPAVAVPTDILTVESLFDDIKTVGGPKKKPSAEAPAEKKPADASEKSADHDAAEKKTTDKKPEENKPVSKIPADIKTVESLFDDDKPADAPKKKPAVLVADMTPAEKKSAESKFDEKKPSESKTVEKESEANPDEKNPDDAPALKKPAVTIKAAAKPADEPSDENPDTEDGGKDEAESTKAKDEE